MAAAIERKMDWKGHHNDRERDVDSRGEVGREAVTAMRRGGREISSINESKDG